MKIAYEAMDQRGLTRSDVLEVASRDEAIDTLRRQGLFVTHIETAAEQLGGEDSLGRRVGRLQIRLPGEDHREMMLFTRQMAMLMSVGTGVVPALAAIGRQSRSRRWREGVMAVHAEVQGGSPLSAALAERPDLFDPVFRSMVAAGEATATLPEMFARLSSLTQQQYEVRNRVVGAMMYPVILIGICLAVTVILIGFVLPRFATLFTNLNLDLPRSTAQLIGLSGLLTSYWPWAVGAVSLSVGGIWALLRTERGRLGFDRLLLRTPSVGALVRSLMLARICRMLGLMIHARVPLLEAVELTMNSTTNAEYKALLQRVRGAVTDGLPLAAGLQGSRLVFPGMVQAVATGEEGGNVAPALLFVADWLDEENRLKIATLSKLVEPIILILMGVVVGGVAVSLFMPLFDMATAALG